MCPELHSSLGQVSGSCLAPLPGGVRSLWDVLEGHSAFGWVVICFSTV